ncbi:spitting Image [Haematobia irritans]|uniref:spitting Image n=1 Tax=Haematobia irritans TaxID=7368 RepID=UPI003F4F98AE
MDEVNTDQLIIYLSKCRHIMTKGCTNLEVLNNFCMEFLKLSEELHGFLDQIKGEQTKNHTEIVYLCLTQIITCIKNMERTFKSEQKQGQVVPAARQHFHDRIIWCLDRLRTCIRLLKSGGYTHGMLAEENTFVDLMDLALDQLLPYTTYKNEESVDETSGDSDSEAILASQDIRSNVDQILSHTLAFANVALKQDKKALSALCQKVLRECIAFQEECAAGIAMSKSNRKIKGSSLENALYQLEDYINEALLRLVFTCFLDYNKLSVERLRTVIKEKSTDDAELDGLIADFDVNIDRTTQIGMFAIAFASNVKIKTIVRSCLASFESLDSCIIPSIQAKVNSNMYAQILEDHFNDEVSNFKLAIQEIVDSHAFTSCYYDLLTQTIKTNDKEYNKESLNDIIKMGDFLYDHFQLSVNQKELRKQGKRLELFNKVTLMLRECQAILICSDKELVSKQRVLKRFKILQSMLRKFIDELGDKATIDNPLNASKSQVFLMGSDEFSESQQMFASIGISPSIRSILYNTPNKNERMQKRLASDSLKGNSSKLPMFTPPVSHPYPVQNFKSVHITKKETAPVHQINRFSIRRKESLRKAMFKRRTSYDSEELYGIYKNNSGSLQISEILDQLNEINSNIAESVLNKSIISK